MKLAAHCIPVHWGGTDEGHMRRWRPKSAKLVDFMPSHLIKINNLSPNSLYVPRNHPRSEQHADMWANPEATGKRHADEWNKDFNDWNMGIDRSQMVVTGINEPPVWRNDMMLARMGAESSMGPLANHQLSTQLQDEGLALVRLQMNDRNRQMVSGSRESIRAEVDLTNAIGVGKTVDYYVAFGERCAQWGIRALILNLSVGWPANAGTDMPPEWGPYLPVYDMMIDCYKQYGIQHMLGLHEYWPLQGVQQHFGWLAGRYRKCPWDVPILLGEIGMSRRTTEGDIAEERAGWLGNMSKEAYWAQLLDYEAVMQEDVSVHSGQVFTWDAFHPFIVSDDFRPILPLVPTNNEFDLMLNYFDGIGTTPPPNGDIDEQALWKEAQRQQLIEFNPDAALQKAVFMDDFDINSREFVYVENGKKYIAQRAEHLHTGVVRVYYVPDGQWDKVTYVDYGNPNEPVDTIPF